MPNRDVTIKGTEVGLDINKISIYRGSISSSNLITVVPKSVFMAGHSFSDDDQQEDYVCQADDPCRTVLNLSIRAANQPPTVTITGSTSAFTNTNVTLTANANDPEGFPMTYLWSTGETTQSITVTSATAQTATYTVTVTDDIGDTGSDTHDIVWTVQTTTTTAAPGTTTTTTTQPPAGSYDCNTVNWATASYDCNTGAISVTPNYGSTTIHSYSPTTATQDTGVVQVTYTFSDSDPAWDNTGTQFTCTNALSVDTTCTGTTTTTTTTTTSTTTTTTAAPETTTTTTAAPSNCYAVQLLYSPLTTCEGQQGVYYVNFSNFCTASLLYTDSSCTTLASNGYYTTASGTQEYRFWDGTQFTTSCANC